MAEFTKGLEDVVAVETSIAFIDGINGVLKYRGIDINDLVKNSYNEVSYLLINGELPDEESLKDYSDHLKYERAITEDIVMVIRTCNFNIEAMDALRTTVSYMSHCDPDLNDNSLEANVRKATRMVAKFPTIVTASARIKAGLEPVEPDPELPHGANFLYMLRGSRPTDLESEIIEKDFILSAEHELNPSTFAARVTISTLSDLHSAIISGVSTLKGPLHGGARMAVMDMIDEIGSPESAESFVLDKVANKQKLMGFGHRVYKTYDPRARVYKELARSIAEEKGDTLWFDIAESIENIAYREFVENKGKLIYPNVDFYAGVLYKYLDIPPRLATAVFAIGRVSGWVAHCLEQYANNRVIRPRAKFVE